MKTNNFVSFLQRHQRLSGKDFLQIDICRRYSKNDFIEMAYSSSKSNKTEIISCDFSDSLLDELSNMVPTNVVSDLLLFKNKVIAPFSIENLVLLFSLNEGFSFFHRRFNYHMQNNMSFFEARKNIIIPENNEKHILHSMASKRLAPGQYRVAFSPRASCFLVHELFGHIFENHKLLNYFLSRGLKCPAGFYFYDDPTSLYGYGSYDFDANLNRSRRCECIHNGEIRASMDLFGDAIIAQRVEDWRKKPEGRMSNIVLNISNDKEDTPSYACDLFVEDCFEGNEASFVSDRITLKTRSCFSSEKKLFKDTIVFSLNVFDFYYKYISSFSTSCQRAIDCFKPQSGWIRTSAEAPGIILDAVQAHMEPASTATH